MIFKETRVPILDNSGVKEALCIRVLGGNPKHNAAFVGDIVVCTIKRVVPKKFKKKRKVLKKGDIQRVLLATTRKGIIRITGHKLRSVLNAVILLRKENPTMPFGNRLKCSVWREIRNTFTKIMIMANNLY